jgi:hypothetical protein
MDGIHGLNSSFEAPMSFARSGRLTTDNDGKEADTNDR